MRARLSDKSVQTELTDKSISHRDLDTTSLSPGITGHKQRAGKTVMWFFWLRADWVPRLLVVCMKDADLPANTCSMPAVKLEKLSRTPEMVMVCFQSKSLIAGTNRFQRLKPLLWKISISGFHHTLQCFTTTWWVVCCCLQTTSMRTSGDRSNLPATKATARRFWCSTYPYLQPVSNYHLSHYEPLTSPSWNTWISLATSRWRGVNDQI